MSPSRTGLRWAPWLAAGVAAIVAAAILRVWMPADDALGTTCVMRRVFGLPCPTCGLTRAFSALAHGDWARASALHPLAPLVAAEFALAWALWGVAIARGAWPVPRRVTIATLIATGALLAGVWMMRLVAGTLPA